MISKSLSIELVFIFIITVVIFMLDVSKLETGQLLIVVTLIANIQQLIKYRSQDIITVFLFFSSLYWLYLLAYYFFGIQYHIYTEYQTPLNTNMVVYLQFIFQRIIFVGVTENNFIRPNSILKIRKSPLIFYTLIILLSLIAFLAMQDKIIVLGNSNVSYGIDTDSSIWFEYNIPILIVAFLFADTNKKKLIILFIALIFMVEPLLFGRRLPFIMVTLTIFNLYFSGKIKPVYLYIGIIFSFISLRFLGATRVESGSDATIISSILSLSSEGIMQNNQGGVIVCAVTYYGLIEQGIFDLSFSLKSLLGQFTSVFIPSTLNIEEAYVNFEALKYANIPGNGGLSSIYLYLWGGFLGVFLGALGFNYIIRNKNSSRIVAVYCIFIFSTFPRWYSYNMMILVKMGIWLIILMLLADFFHKHLKKN